MVIGLGSCFSNTVLLGIPLIPRALGDDALVPLFLLISVHGITVFTAVTVIIEITRGRDAGLANLPKQVASGLIGNPLIIGLGLGFLWKLTDLGIHPVAADVFHLVDDKCDTSSPIRFREFIGKLLNFGLISSSDSSHDFKKCNPSAGGVYSRVLARP